MAKGAGCVHFNGSVATPSGGVCEECGSNVNLRVCTTCGHVGCCESQKGHNTAHAKSAQHPVIKSLPVESGHFTWCYECKDYV